MIIIGPDELGMPLNTDGLPIGAFQSLDESIIRVCSCPKTIADSEDALVVLRIHGDATVVRHPSGQN